MTEFMAKFDAILLAMEPQPGTCGSCEHQRSGDLPEWEHMPEFCAVFSHGHAWNELAFCFKMSQPCDKWVKRIAK
jgi:hypothetical protein